MNRWKFDASMEVQERPTLTERKKKTWAETLANTDFETMSRNKDSPWLWQISSLQKQNQNWSLGFLDQDTLADLCGAAALQLTFALGNH